MANTSSLANITTAAQGLSNLILVTPQKTIGYQPQPPPVKTGDPAQQEKPIIFHYEGEQTATIESDITDHYVEDNTSIQDQIAIKPVIITTQGFVGELNNVPPNEVLAGLKAVADKLSIISAYTPALSVAAIQAYNDAAFLYSSAANLAASAVSGWDSLSSNGGTTIISGGVDSSGNPLIQQKPRQTVQQQYFQKFYAYQQKRTLFTIQTPWAIFKDMAIKSLRAVQEASSNVITDFEVTFKQMRFAATLTSTVNQSYSTPVGSDFSQGRASAQGSSEVDLGNNSVGPSSGFSASGPVSQ